MTSEFLANNERDINGIRERATIERRAYQKAYRLKHKKRIIESQKRYIERNKEKLRAYQKAYRAQHAEKIREYQRAYRKKRVYIEKT